MCERKPQVRTFSGRLPSTSCTCRRSMKGSRIWCSRWMTTTRFSCSQSAPPPSSPPSASPNQSLNAALSSNTCRGAVYGLTFQVEHNL